MKQVSFEEIGSVTATFYASEGVKGGMAVKLSAGETVDVCAAGERFCGVAAAGEKLGCAAVQVGGFATLRCSGEGVGPGWVRLTADGTGGVKKAAEGDQAGEYLVVSADGADGTAVVLL